MGKGNVGLVGDVNISKPVKLEHLSATVEVYGKRFSILATHSLKSGAVIIREGTLGLVHQHIIELNDARIRINDVRRQIQRLFEEAVKDR